MEKKRYGMLLIAGIVMLFMVIGAAACLAVYAEDDRETAKTVSNRPVIDTAKQTKVTIYTEGETYIAAGQLKPVRTDSSDSELVLELDGTIEKRNDAEKEPLRVDVYAEGEPQATSLTVYDQDQVYGFYSIAPLSVKVSDHINDVELYGHLVGHYGVEDASST